jgi:flagellar biosynthesis protein FlhB
MAERDHDSKTEQPSERHINEAMEQGQFAKAPELQITVLLAAALGVLAFTARSSAQDIAQYAISVFDRYPVTAVELATIPGLLGTALLTVGKVLLPMLLSCCGAALLVGGFQSGFQLTPKAFGVKFENLNIATGFSRIFSKATWVHAGIDVLKLLAIGCALYLGARTLLADPLFTAPVEAAYLAQFLNRTAQEFFGRLLFALGLIAALSYAWEKFKTSRDLMMTREEIREERHNVEGNAMVKSAQRRLARRLMQRQMLSAVATADVVVTNPTHYAVALKYERGKDRAPVVLAKGENRFARRLREIAEEHGVPIIENKPVARLLFAIGQVGQVIPPELFQAVAEILSVVYRTHRYYFHRLKVRRLEGVA